MLSEIEFNFDLLFIIESDNCSAQCKSSERFHYVQQIADKIAEQCLEYLT